VKQKRHIVLDLRYSAMLRILILIVSYGGFGSQVRGSLGQ